MCWDVYRNLWKRDFARVCRGRSKVRKQTMNKPANTACQGEGVFWLFMGCWGNFTIYRIQRSKNLESNQFPFIIFELRCQTEFLMESGKQTIGAKSKIDMFSLIYFFDKLKKEIKILDKVRIFLLIAHLNWCIRFIYRNSISRKYSISKISKKSRFPTAIQVQQKTEERMMPSNLLIHLEKLAMN